MDVSLLLCNPIRRSDERSNYKDSFLQFNVYKQTERFSDPYICNKHQHENSQFLLSEGDFIPVETLELRIRENYKKRGGGGKDGRETGASSKARNRST